MAIAKVMAIAMVMATAIAIAMFIDIAIAIAIIIVIFLVIVIDNVNIFGVVIAVAIAIAIVIVITIVIAIETAITIAMFIATNIYIAVGIICVITFFYTLIGGLKAVVRTDMIQMFIFIGGGIAAHYMIPTISGNSWSNLIQLAANADKLTFISFTDPTPFIIGVFGGILFDMATHGVDQDFVQRLTANKTLKGAQFSIVMSSFISISVGFLFLSIGSLLWSHYQLSIAPEIANDKIFAHFITSYFPIGLKGLMVAGVLAATMSTLDSSINALSSCLYNDIFKHNYTNAEEIKKSYRRDTLIITLGLMLIAFIASNSDSLLYFGLKITSWTAGSLLAVFFATVIFKTTQLTSKTVIIAYLAGIIGVYINTFHLEWNWNFNVYFGFIFASIPLTTSNFIKSSPTH